jgi:hypothetical protein
LAFAFLSRADTSAGGVCIHELLLVLLQRLHSVKGLGDVMGVDLTDHHTLVAVSLDYSVASADQAVCYLVYRVLMVYITYLACRRDSTVSSGLELVLAFVERGMCDGREHVVGIPLGCSQVL